ncbi:radical SAM protein [Catenuloplanes japonicus]|uniref:radical SAM protein n=1 Tax=Catenuloplanes japonicus TaxID=33876 RepID=UPI0005248075|nr:radical SAM protein [Catenuloplanes japonicus]
MTIDRLDLAGKLYQPGVYPAVARVASGKRSESPLVVDLDPTTFCDLACPECISGKLLNQGRFTPERLVALAGELVEMGVRAVILIGGGEPLAHRGTRRVVTVLGEAGIAIGVVTNGTMIDRNLDELAAHASWVRVSVDAATSETYRSVRPDRKGGSAFDRVIANMRAFARVRTGALGYSFLVVARRAADGTVESNHHEVFEAARLARDIGCDYFEVKALFDEGHHIIGLGDEMRDSVARQIEKAQSLIEVVNSSTMDSVQRDDGPVQPKAYHRCGVTELRTLVTPSGVYVCPYHRGNPAARLGDAVTETLPEIWRRSDRGIVDPSRDCTFHCARHGSNLELHEIAAGRGRPVHDDDQDLFL